MDHTVEIIGTGVIVCLGIAGMIAAFFERKNGPKPKRVLQELEEHLGGASFQEGWERGVAFEFDDIDMRVLLYYESSGEYAFPRFRITAPIPRPLSSTLLYSHRDPLHQRHRRRDTRILTPWPDRPHWMLQTTDKASAEHWMKALPEPGAWLGELAWLEFAEATMRFDISGAADLRQIMVALQWLSAIAQGLAALPPRET